MSSSSSTTIAAIRLSSLISTNGERRNVERLEAWSLLVKTKRTSARRSPRVATRSTSHCRPEVIGGPPVRHLELSTASDAGVYDRRRSSEENVVGE